MHKTFRIHSNEIPRFPNTQNDFKASKILIHSLLFKMRFRLAANKDNFIVA